MNEEKNTNIFGMEKAGLFGMFRISVGMFFYFVTIDKLQGYTMLIYVGLIALVILAIPTLHYEKSCKTRTKLLLWLFYFCILSILVFKFSYLIP